MAPPTGNSKIPPGWGGGGIKNPNLLETQGNCNSERYATFADDLTAKTTGAREIYRMLKIFEECGKQYKIHINWDIIKIIIGEQMYATYEVRKRLHVKYQNTICHKWNAARAEN